jgi:mannose-6-phosphate isomerase-like protein (cupin superfamily)
VNGWVRVAYEDQGEPMVMHAGDCFLQPPHIRHRVLECSDQMEVVEIACPAEHETLVEHEIRLPTGVIDTERDFGGQQFVFHEGEKVPWTAWIAEGFEYRDTGIGAATRGAASAITVRATGPVDSLVLDHDDDIRIIFICEGNATLACAGEEAQQLGKSDACAIPPGTDCRMGGISPDLLFLEVRAPA